MTDCGASRPLLLCAGRWCCRAAVNCGARGEPMEREGEPTGRLEGEPERRPEDEEAMLSRSMSSAWAWARRRAAAEGCGSDCGCCRVLVELRREPLLRASDAVVARLPPPASKVALLRLVACETADQPPSAAGAGMAMAKVAAVATESMDPGMATLPSLVRGEAMCDAGVRRPRSRRSLSRSPFSKARMGADMRSLS